MVDGQYYIFTISYDITDLYNENQSNLFYSTIDPLTGAYNRRYLSDHMQLVEGTLMAMIDFDNFKMINDYEGHSVGDEILRDFVAFVRERLYELAWCVRLGGDEFLLVFPRDYEEAGLRKSLMRVRHQFEEHYDQYKYLSFSFGLGRASASFSDTLTMLDEAMYADKARKRNR